MPPNSTAKAIASAMRLRTRATENGRADEIIELTQFQAKTRPVSLYPYRFSIEFAALRLFLT
jgi:hypothetical protein